MTLCQCGTLKWKKIGCWASPIKKDFLPIAWKKLISPKIPLAFTLPSSLPTQTHVGLKCHQRVVDGNQILLLKAWPKYRWILGQRYGWCGLKLRKRTTSEAKVKQTLSLTPSSISTSHPPSFSDHSSKHHKQQTSFQLGKRPASRSASVVHVWRLHFSIACPMISQDDP